MNDEIHIEYQLAPFHRRIFAYVIDFLIAALLGIMVFLGYRAICFSTSSFKAAEATIADTIASSGLYVANSSSGNGYSDVVSYYGDDKDVSGTELKDYYVKALDSYFVYVGKTATSQDYNDLHSTYLSYLLGDNFVYEGNALFITKDGVVEENEACTALDSYYASEVYGPYITSVGIPALQKIVPEYASSLHYESMVLIFGGVPTATLLACILTFYVPPLFLRRGRQTIGRFLFHIGQLDRRCLVPSFGRFTAEASIFILGVILLSLFTFAVPLLFSFSMMAFTKKRQTFAMYMLGIVDVSCEQDRLYFSLAEASLSEEKEGKAAHDFVPINRRDS
jgi:uncharacterized RDD family membrane protein YckC